VKKTPYFIALYNLHLSLNVPPTPYEKQSLIRTVYLNYSIPPVPIGNQERDRVSPLERFIVLPVDPKYPAPPRYFFKIDEEDNFDEEDNYFAISEEDLNYHPPDVDWWQKDYAVFLDEYRNLRSFLDGYIENKIGLADLLWLNQALETMGPGLVYLKKRKNFPISQLDFYNKEEFFNKPFLSFSTSELSVCLLPLIKKFTPNVVILFQAYLELMSLLENKPVIRRCTAYQTTRIPPCQNIFIASSTSGPIRKFCSDKCRRRIHEHEKKYPEDKVKKQAILDAKMKNKQ
jgi:hypothetical protein